MNYLPTSVLMITLCLFVIPLCFGQENKSVKWSPPDKTFSVEVPVGLKEIEGEYPDSDPDGFEKIRLYGEVSGNYTFRIVVLDLLEKLKQLPSDQKLNGLQFMVGGDDDREFTEKYVKIDGLNAKEIVYIKQVNKGLLIDGCDRIYVLALHTKDRKDLDSKVANRFFSSFRLKN